MAGSFYIRRGEARQIAEANGIGRRLFEQILTTLPTYAPPSLPSAPDRQRRRLYKRADVETAFRPVSVSK